MRRIWIHFTERQAAAIAAEARRRNVPMSAIVREAVADKFGLEAEQVDIGRPYKSPAEPLDSDVSPSEPTLE